MPAIRENQHGLDHQLLVTSGKVVAFRLESRREKELLKRSLKEENILPLV